MVRYLLGNVESSRLILERPVACAEFAKNRIERFPDTSRPDMPSGHIESQHFYETLNRIVYCRNRQDVFWMCHEATLVNRSSQARNALGPELTYLEIRSSIDFGSKTNVGSVILDRSIPGLSCPIIPMMIDLIDQHAVCGQRQLIILSGCPRERPRPLRAPHACPSTYSSTTRHSIICSTRRKGCVFDACCARFP